MQTDTQSGKGPSLGEPAPFIESIASRKSQRHGNSKGGWTILISHPQDLLPLFRTRTINYVLCKRRTRVVLLYNGDLAESLSDGNFFTKYITRHSVAFLDDSGNIISPVYGVGKDSDDEEVKGVFVIDPDGVLRMKLYFDPAQARNLYEILKLVDTLQQADRQKKSKPSSGVWKRRLSIINKPGAVPEEG